MHATQTAYILAKARFDVLDDALEAAEGVQANERATAEWEAACAALEAAEDAMLDWSWSVVSALPGADEARPAYDAAKAYRPVARIRMIDLAARLRA